MPWYRTGTVNVTLNSTTVTGTGTAFAANSRVGDAFLGPDGRWYEVANIASDAVLSILPAYQGATAAAGTYALVPVQGYVKASADQLRAIVASFGDKLAALGSTGNYDTLPVSKGGTGSTDAPTALTALGALAKAGGTLTGALNGATPVTLASAATLNIGAAAANSVNVTGTTAITAFDSITAGARRTLFFAGALTLTHNSSSLILPGSASIVTAAGDIAEFESLGSGNWKCIDFTRASGKALSFAFDRSNLLGALSQASGVPTGAAMQVISNANGVALKYANGLMVCLGSASGTTSSGSANITAVNFPDTFAETPKVATNLMTSLPSRFSSTAYSVSAAQIGIAIGDNSGGGAAVTVGYIAIGRWFV